MLRLDHHQDAPRFEDVHQPVRDLRGHAFLYLRTAGVNVDQPGQLGQSGNLTLFVWYIADVRRTKKGHQVMLAGAVNLDVPHQHQFVVVGVEHGGQDVLSPLAQPGELLREGPGDPGRGVPQPVPLRVLADGEQDLLHRALDTCGVEVGAQRFSPDEPPWPWLPFGGWPGAEPGPPSGPAWPLPADGWSLTSAAAVRASSLGVSTGGRADGSRLPYPG